MCAQTVHNGIACHQTHCVFMDWVPTFPHGFTRWADTWDSFSFTEGIVNSICQATKSPLLEMKRWPLFWSALVSNTTRWPSKGFFFPPVSCASVWLWNPRGAITLLEEAASCKAPEYFSMEICLFLLSGIKCSSVQQSHLPREARVCWILCGVLGNPCTASPQALSLPGSPPPPPGNLLGAVSVPVPALAFLLVPSYWFWTKNKEGSRDCISRQDLALPEITAYLFVHLKGKSKFLLSFFPLELLCFRPNPRPGREEQRKLYFLGWRDFILCTSPTVKLWTWAVPFLHMYSQLTTLAL